MSDAPGMRALGTAALLTLAAALAGVVALEVLGGTWDDDAPPQAAAGSAMPAQVPSAGPGQAEVPSPRAQWAQAALARPLFNRGRRPLATAQAEAGPAGLPRLAGVVIHGQERSAILVPSDGGKAVVAREGAQAAGVLVQTIQAGQVTVTGPAGTRVLRPTFDPRPPAYAALPAQPGFAAGLPQSPALFQPYAGAAPPGAAAIAR